MEQEISGIFKFPEKRTTSRGEPKFSKRISGKFLFHSILNRNFQKFWSNGTRPVWLLLLWHTKSRLRLLLASKAVFLENYLAVSTWILNGSSVECLKKKYQPFSLAGIRFGSLVNQISGLKSAWCRSELCLTLLLCNCCYKWILRNNPRNQTNIFRLNITLTTPRSQSCIIKSFLQG